ncbi:hypothetical protein SPONN_1621 [uncultured Candidatus Thioglobus sp.]|nr:hypothetical protein SPONN_1621 [uncultured Candidatus Thioglobus sp.]
MCPGLLDHYNYLAAKQKGQLYCPFILFLFIKLNNRKQNLYKILLTIIQKILLKR